MKPTPDSTGQRPFMHTAEATLAVLLEDLRGRFYAGEDPHAFYRDRRALAKAVSWPALWLDRRGVNCTQDRYRALVVARLEAIKQHGVPSKFGAFLPGYLLKCLQDWFAWHGEELYQELKHARNAMEVALLSIGFDDESDGKPRCDRNTQDSIEALAGLHRILANRRTSANRPAAQKQSLLDLS